MLYDVIIVGAGPAGLSAALILGRCRRNLLVLDSNEPRNQVSSALHGYLTRDGINPSALRDLGRADLSKYPSIALRSEKIISARRTERGFQVCTRDGRIEQCRLLLLATGRTDPLPEITGFREFYGKGVYHCPYCDGWETRGKKLVVFGNGAFVSDLAFELLTWSEDITICSHGPFEAPTNSRRFPVITHPILALKGTALGGLSAIEFSTGDSLDCDAIFFCSRCEQRSHLPEQLGCNFDEEASVLCTKNTATGVPGLYIAGNVRGGVHLAITAAAEGAEAAMAMNEALLERDYAR